MLCLCDGGGVGELEEKNDGKVGPISQILYN